MLVGPVLLALLMGALGPWVRANPAPVGEEAAIRDDACPCTPPATNRSRPW